MDIRTPVATIYGAQADQFKELWEKQILKIREKFSAAITEVKMPKENPTDVPILYIEKKYILDVLKTLKSECDYIFLSDITATDEENEPRFEIVYQLFSQVTRSRIRLKVRLHSHETMISATSIWPAANWAEREVFDMFGVEFEGHPDLRRILMDERWVGHPLRKDYPLRGYQIFSEPMEINEKLLEDKHV